MASSFPKKLSVAAYNRLMAERTEVELRVPRPNGEEPLPRGTFKENLKIGADGVVCGFTNLVGSDPGDRAPARDNSRD